MARHQESERFRINGRLGTSLLVASSIGLILSLMAQSGSLPEPMQRIWGRMPTFWWCAVLGLFAGGMSMLWSSSHAATTWRPRSGGRRFETAVLYTRHDCPLCDDAREILKLYRHWLPPIREIDIDIHADFRDTFCKCVPVLEIDDEIRFRGRISEPLLQRLLEGSPPVGKTTTPP